MISRTRPALVVLDRSFAATSRGAALIKLHQGRSVVDRLEIRVVSHDSGSSPMSPPRPPEGGAPAPAAVAVAEAPAPAAAPPLGGLLFIEARKA